MNTEETTFYINLGREIRNARKATGRTQADLAKALGVSRSTIGMIETGRQAVLALHLARLHGLIGLRVDGLTPEASAQLAGHRALVAQNEQLHAHLRRIRDLANTPPEAAS